MARWDGDRAQGSERPLGCRGCHSGLVKIAGAPSMRGASARAYALRPCKPRINFVRMRPVCSATLAHGQLSEPRHTSEVGYLPQGLARRERHGGAPLLWIVGLRGEYKVLPRSCFLV